MFGSQREHAKTHKNVKNQGSESLVLASSSYPSMKPLPPSGLLVRVYRVAEVLNGFYEMASVRL